ncbi:MAG: AAA family ATPase [Pseudomonadota bacterium]
MKQLWVLAGGNGAGKSTFYNTRLKPFGIPFINADIIAKKLYPDSADDNSYFAAKVAEGIRQRLIKEGRSFCMETVFSHPSKIDFIARAKALNYQIIFVFIHLKLNTLNQARVASRVRLGGHSVPDEKILARIPRTLANAAKVIPLCDEVRVLDNSSAENPFRPIITIKEHQVLFAEDPLPEWAAALTQ